MVSPATRLLATSYQIRSKGERKSGPCHPWGYPPLKNSRIKRVEMRANGFADRREGRNPGTRGLYGQFAHFRELAEASMVRVNEGHSRPSNGKGRTQSKARSDNMKRAK